jgi:TusE/DsrC/DsvC family sulfur relay protein
MYFSDDHRVKEQTMATSIIEMPARDAEGYLVEPSTWNEDVAEVIAHELGINLEDDHWHVIRFMRAFYDEHRVPADARFAMKHLESRYPGAGRSRMFELFPYGYVGQACKIAGMRRPRGWSTG